MNHLHISISILSRLSQIADTQIKYSIYLLE